MSNAGWRDIGNDSSGSLGKRAWQPDDASTPESTALPSGRGLKRAFGVAALLAISVAIGFVIIWLRPPKPACLAVIGCGYEDNLLLPLNALGWHGSLVLDRKVAVEQNVVHWPWDPATKLRRAKDPIELKGELTWKKIWKDVSRFPEKTLVVFISLHGMAEKDDVFFLGDDPRLQSRIAFSEVLDDVQKLNDKTVLLLLDIGQMESHWPIGMLHNDVVQRLKEKYKSRIEKMGNLAVICAASPDQRSWTSNEWHNSVFGHYVSEGLQGAALGGSAGNITTGKLFDYVEKKVNGWTQTNRARTQDPVFLGNPALREVDLVYVAEPYEERQPQAAKSLDLKSIEMVWTEWKKIKENRPFVQSPHIWRLYQATALRYEQLKRADDPTNKADELKSQLDKLQDEIEKTRSLKPAMECVGNSLPMYQVLGYRPVTTDVGALFRGLRNADPEKIDELLGRFKNSPREEKEFLQAEVGRLFLADVSQQTKLERDLDQAWLASVEAKLKLPRRPAEVQLYKMTRDAQTMDDETIKLALQVHVLAEQAALSSQVTPADAERYSGVIAPWIQVDVEKADELRRMGEDFLFGDAKEHGREATRLLHQAEEIYKRVTDEARIWQRGLATEDQTWSDLPELANWLALMPPGPMLKETQALRDDLPALRKNLAELSRLLGTATGRPDVVKVALLTGKVQRAHQDLREQYRLAAEKLTDVVFQRNWHEIDSVLGVPPVNGDIDLRLNLLRYSHKIAGELHAANRKGPVEEEETLETRTKRQRNIVEAMVGSFGDNVDKLPLNVDEKLQSFFLKMPEVIGGKSGEPADRLTPLMEAAQLCRIIPAGLVREISKDPYHPVERLRRIRMFRLLMKQAERDALDHWFDPGLEKEEGEKSAYYLGAGKAYVNGASELIKDDVSKDMLLGEAKRFEKQNLQLARLDGPVAVTKYWTTEQDYPLTWEIKAEGNLPRGRPMAWLQLVAHDAQKPSRVLGPREELAWPPVTKPFRLLKSALWPEGDPSEKREVTFHAIYRGQHLQSKVTFDRSRPDVIVRQIPPPKAGHLAVRMDSAFNYGAISIVLDNSGSMRYLQPMKKDGNGMPIFKESLPADKQKDSLCRFDYAIKALKGVLGQIPDGTSLSVMTFSSENQQRTEPQLLRRPFYLKRRSNQIADLMADFDLMNSNPRKHFNNNSPIVDAIIKAMEEGFPAGFDGPKVVLVLTDGKDNASVNQNSINVNRLIRAKLKAANLRHNDIEVVVVCFVNEKNEKEEYDDAKEQFGILEEDFTPKGQLKIQPDEKELGRTILDAIQPRLQLFYNNRKPVPGFDPGHAINHPDIKEFLWMPTPLPSDQYEVRLSRGRLKKANVDLTPAENLFMVLKRRNTGFFLERGVVGQQPEALRAMGNMWQEKNGWQVSLLANRVDIRNQFEQVVAFENVAIEEKESIRQVYPGLVWLELDVGDKKFDDSLRWENAWDIAAPAFRVKMSAWPRQARPRLSAWYWPNDRVDRIGFLKNRFVRKLPTLAIGKDVDVAPAQLPAIESVDWEKHNGKKTLVVRAVYPEGKPIMLDFAQAPVRDGNVELEHRYYNFADAPGRYTVFIQGIDETTRNLDLVSIDLAVFKEMAERVVFPRDNNPMPEIFLPTNFQRREE